MKDVLDWIVFAKSFLISYVVTYGFSWAYSVRIYKRYIIVNNMFLRKLLICSSERLHNKYVKVDDRKKLTVHSLVLYIISTVILVMALIMMFVPEMPCEPFELPISRRGGITIDSWNSKLPILSIDLLACYAILNPLIWGAYIVPIKQETTYKPNRLEKFTLCATILLFLFFVGWLLYKLFVF